MEYERECCILGSKGGSQIKKRTVATYFRFGRAENILDTSPETKREEKKQR